MARLARYFLCSAAALAVAAAFAATEEIELVVGGGAVIDVPDGIARVSTSSPEIVDVTTASDREILFNARSLGQATLIVWSPAGARRVYNVTVTPNLAPIRALLKSTFPGEEIDVRAAKDALSLVGRVSSQSVADRALALAAPAAKAVVSNLQVGPAPVERQIVLRVKFAEVNRTAAQAFGVNILSTGALNTIGRVTTGQFPSASPGKIAAGGASEFSLSDVLNVFAFRPDLNLGATIKDLETRGLLEVLAEPNLVTTNGKEASFLVGGEFPVPIVQGGANAGAISIQFREYGIRLTFLPVTTARGTVRLHVKPEVSSIDFANGVTVSGFSIPALLTRRMESDLELAEGQSFVIAGLLDNRVTETLQRIPGLAHIPLLGALFRSRSENKAKTELLVMVTPETAMPVAAGVNPLPAMPKPFLPSPKETSKQP